MTCSFSSRNLPTRERQPVRTACDRTTAYALFSKGISWSLGFVPSVVIPATLATNSAIQNA
jgi:hypothetical protein